MNLINNSNYISHEQHEWQRKPRERVEEDTSRTDRRENKEKYNLRIDDGPHPKKSENFPSHISHCFSHPIRLLLRTLLRRAPNPSTYFMLSPLFVFSALMTIEKFTKEPSEPNKKKRNGKNFERKK